MSNDPYTTPESTTGVVSSGDRWEAPSLKELLFSFQGRIPRSQYWKAYLITFVISLVAFLPLGILSGMSSQGGEPGAGAAIAGILMLILYIPLVWIGFATACKRWHDRGKSGWWSLISLIPFIGGIWFFVEVGCLRGNEGPNQYGPDPLQ